MGVGSAATQIDGGNFDHTWNQWYVNGHIRDSADPAKAAGHWNRWRDDVLLLRSLGVQTYRLGIEWARVEPEEGLFDEEAIAHFKEEIMLLLGMRIQPLVTLQHFTNPMWFERKGGWKRYENVPYFITYVEKIIRSIGHLVNEYVTFDEPNVYVSNSFRNGVWPPGESNARTALKVLNNIVATHHEAYRVIHDMRRGMGFNNSKVGCTVRMQVYTPLNEKSPLHRKTAEEADKMEKHLIQALTTGEFHMPFRNIAGDRRGTYCDFHGLNYYGRCTVSTARAASDVSGWKNDLGWEIYPEGLSDCCRKLYGLAPIPIYITANGACDLNDSFRSRYIYDHLQVLSQIRLPVKRYYYWCFLDGFEWLEGNYVKFGIIGTTPRTLERNLKKSGEFYSEMMRNRVMTQELYDSYVAEQVYHY